MKKMNVYWLHIVWIYSLYQSIWILSGKYSYRKWRESQVISTMEDNIIHFFALFWFDSNRYEDRLDAKLPIWQWHFIYEMEDVSTSNWQHTLAITITELPSLKFFRECIMLISFTFSWWPMEWSCLCCLCWGYCSKMNKITMNEKHLIAKEV